MPHAPFADVRSRLGAANHPGTQVYLRKGFEHFKAPPVMPEGGHKALRGADGLLEGIVTAQSAGVCSSWSSETNRACRSFTLPNQDHFEVETERPLADILGSKRAPLKLPPDIKRGDVIDVKQVAPQPWITRNGHTMMFRCLSKTRKVPMDSTPHPTQADARQDTVVKTLEEALSKLGQEGPASASDRRTEMATSDAQQMALADLRQTVNRLAVGQQQTAYLPWAEWAVNRVK